MKQGNEAGCAILVGLFIVLAIVVAIVQWVAQHAIPVAIAAFLLGTLAAYAAARAREVRKARVQRRARASLQVEATRSQVERRLAIAQEFMRLAGDALAASPPGQVPRWGSDLDDLLAEAEQLRRSAHEPPAGQGVPRDSSERLDSTTLIEAVDALAALLSSRRDAALSPWQQQPEALRQLRRARTRLLVAQDSVAQRVQQ